VEGPVDASRFIPADADADVDALRAAAARCEGCPLHGPATQTVFGEGQPRARLMLVGEAPGDREDREGRPFVGPAGRELDRALEAAGLARDEVYLTNAVKHFKFHERGKRRIHAKPSRAEVKACWPWLAAELDALAPVGILALGATAAQALFGAAVRVTKDRGTPLESALAPVAMVTIHPSSILRARSDAEREAQRAAFGADVAAFAAAAPR
jgi:uracil-DNA glycosylase family protein